MNVTKIGKLHRREIQIICFSDDMAGEAHGYHFITNKSYNNECAVLWYQFFVGEHYNIKLMMLIKIYNDTFTVKGIVHEKSKKKNILDLN